MTDSAIVIGVGAVDGVGGALCRRFAREGLRVFAAGRTLEKLEAVAAAAEGRGSGSVMAVKTDGTVAEELSALFDRVETDAGAPPKLVVYNAGNNFPKDTLELTPEEFEGSWRVCGFGGFLCAQESARRMIPAGGGTLIFTGATASMRSKPPFVAFAAAKAAERAVAWGAARSFGAQGLHVAHVIVDGVIDGDQVNRRFPQAKEHLGEAGMLSPDAIADAMWMLHNQDPRAWTLELDLRPSTESF